MDDKYILLIQVLANIGTFLGSLVAIFTLYEMKKQRECSLKPDIVVENINFLYINGDNNSDKISMTPYNWRVDESVLPQNKEIKYNTSTFALKLYNIGLEVAKNINITWNFDIEYFINFLDDYYSEEFIFMFDDDYNSDLRLLDGASLVKLDGLNHNYYFEYLNNHDNSTVKVDFCLLYTKLVSAWLFYKFQYGLESADELNQLLEEFMNLPKLEMHIKYSDITNKIYHKKYVFDFDIICFSKSKIALKSIVTSEMI